MTRTEFDVWKSNPDKTLKPYKCVHCVFADGSNIFGECDIRPEVHWYGEVCPDNCSDFGLCDDSLLEYRFMRYEGVV